MIAKQCGEERVIVSDGFRNLDSLI